MPRPLKLLTLSKAWPGVFIACVPWPGLGGALLSAPGVCKTAASSYIRLCFALGFRGLFLLLCRVSEAVPTLAHFPDLQSVGLILGPP